MRARSTRSRSDGEREFKAVEVPRLLLALGIEFRDHNGELWACCPHPKHNEHTASWSIGDAGEHYCFGCKWNGGVLELVLKVVGLSSFGAAHQWVQEKGLYLDGPLPLAVQVQVTRPDLSRPEVQVPADARFGPIEKWVTPAKRYAIKRGLTEAQVQRWGIGYACGGYYANRIIIPTRTRAGRLINITGRAWSPTKTPKYLNAKELHGWDASAVFGEQHWPEYPARSTLVLCEGELNALACERVGAEFIGALGGSQLEKEQVLKFSQFQRVILAVDIDRAGTDIAANLRATLVRWKRVSRVAFPDDRDPNDLEGKDPDLLRRLLWASSDPAS